MMKKLSMAIAAFVVAGAVAAISGFVSTQAVHAETLAKNAVEIQVAQAAAPAAPAAPAAAPTAAATPAAAPAADAPIADLIAKADVARGKTVAKVCMACHKFENDGKNGVGPNLFGVVGRKKEGAAGFKYSGAIGKSAGGSTWTVEELNKYITDPKAYAPGNKMAFAGLKKVEDRAAVLAYLKSLK